jgi:hypothetical protein
MKKRPVAEEFFVEGRQTEGRTEIHNYANCPFSQFLRKNLKYLMDFINWLIEFF